ncbi:MAG: hypothetical protein AAF620_00360 [Bacteroidota bacterium]
MMIKFADLPPFDASLKDFSFLKIGDEVILDALDLLNLREEDKIIDQTELAYIHAIIINCKVVILQNQNGSLKIQFVELSKEEQVYRMQYKGMLKSHQNLINRIESKIVKNQICLAKIKLMQSIFPLRDYSIYWFMFTRKKQLLEAINITFFFGLFVYEN